MVNNVETYCNVPLVIGRGAQWFKQVSPLGGTKVFALTGKVVNAGLLEVPLGTTFQEIIYGIGQGLPEGKECKAVAVGGPTGGYLSAAMLDMPAAYDSLTAVGCTMGSSSIEVCDQETCMVDQAKRFFAFCQAESCGKCVPCRLGSTRIANILSRTVSGQGMEGDIERLEELGTTLKATALCNLGREAANSVLTTIRSFREEYEAHVAEKRCPALQCKELIAYQILPEKCMGCGICLRSCPVKAITGEKRVAHVISRELCIKCGTCFESCPPKFRAIERVSGEVPAPVVP